MTKTLVLACAAALALAACGTAHEDAATDPGTGAGAGAGTGGGTGGGTGAGSTTPIDGAALYASDCAGCHGDLATSSKRGATAARIAAAVSANMGGMGALNGLTPDQLAALETALAGTTPPAACTYTYGAWGACQPDGTQSRTVASATPAGCTGTPVLTQSCTYVPPPAGTCTSFTYSAWAPATCPSSGQQTRTVLTSSPAGCTGGSPVLAQACTPPLDGAALYAASCQRCHGALASSDLKGKSISVSLIKSKGMTQGLTDAQLQAIVTAVGP